MPYTPTNHPYIPGDPYSYDLKWLVSSQKESISKADLAATQALQAISDAASALTAAGAAATAATNAANSAAQASAQASSASSSATQAAASAAEALQAVDDSITAEIISSADWIDSENTTVTVVDQFGVKIGNLFFFRVDFRASEDHRVLQFKAPYTNFVAPIPFPVYAQSSAGGPYDTFERLVGGSAGSMNVTFPNYTTNLSRISGILILYEPQ